MVFIISKKTGVITGWWPCIHLLSFIHSITEHSAGYPHYRADALTSHLLSGLQMWNKDQKVVTDTGKDYRNTLNDANIRVNDDWHS